MINRAFPFTPGESVERVFRGYTTRQEIFWHALADTYYAAVYGFGHTRYPAPGVYFNMENLGKWQDKVVEAWEKEAKREAGMTGVAANDFPLHLWLYCYQRMLAAKDMPTNPPEFPVD